jgi:DNA-binding transcriptional ArsR family regulator
MRPTINAFEAVADPSRRYMLNLLSEKSLSINMLAANFDMSRPAVSKHIKVLERAGFISITTIGRERYCILQKQGFDELQSWIDHFDSFWQTKLNMLEALMKEKAKK